MGRQCLRGLAMTEVTDMRDQLRMIGMVALITTALFSGAPEAASPWAQTLSQQALDNGFLTRLPPSVSVALGLAKAQEGTDVRQILTKQGHQVRTFNVSVANHADLIVLDLNAQSGATLAYLCAPDGKLRKAVSYQPPGEPKTLSTSEAQAGFNRQKQYWSARAKAVPAAAAPASPSPAASPAQPGHGT
jgi:hypothetical protein